MQRGRGRVQGSGVGRGCDARGHVRLSKQVSGTKHSGKFTWRGSSGTFSWNRRDPSIRTYAPAAAFKRVSSYGEPGLEIDAKTSFKGESVAWKITSHRPSGCVDVRFWVSWRRDLAFVGRDPDPPVPEYVASWVQALDDNSIKSGKGRTALSVIPFQPRPKEPQSTRCAR